MKFEVKHKDSTLNVVLDTESSEFSIDENSGSYQLSHENGRYMLRIGTKLYRLDNINYDGSVIEFTIDGIWYSAEVKDEQELLLDRLGFKTGVAAAEGILNAPMPGKILDILVSEGDEVTKDQPVAILEAMKMENELKSPIDGKVLTVDAEVGQSLEKNSRIMEIESIG